MVFVMVVCGRVAAFAQAQKTDMPGYAQLDIAATLGHKSDTAIGGEAGWHINPDLAVFVEGGHIGNAASADIEAGANLIANNVGATANAISKVNYFDVGVRYSFVMNNPKVHPYAAIGVGAAQVKNETTFVVNGTAFAPDALGIQVGTDLSGSETKPFIMIGAGASVDFATRYLLDVSYRFGAVTGATSAVNGTATLKTSRVQIGLGIKF